ncbi:hypothetical protein C8R48DRAFT_776498 [Suillus tomentosus]|nr:hypothetical protein C8R48DRAFT_776498 [Suillus tomentosus]
MSWNKENYYSINQSLLLPTLTGTLAFVTYSFTVGSCPATSIAILNDKQIVRQPMLLLPQALYAIPDASSTIQRFAHASRAELIPEDALVVDTDQEPALQELLEKFATFPGTWRYNCSQSSHQPRCHCAFDGPSPTPADPTMNEFGVLEKGDAQVAKASGETTTTRRLSVRASPSINSRVPRQVSGPPSADGIPRKSNRDSVSFSTLHKASTGSVASTTSVLSAKQHTRIDFLLCLRQKDDERGDYQVVNGDHLALRYGIMDILGKGLFGQVLSCRDHQTGESVAIKIIRNKKRFHHQALMEIKILDNLRKWDHKEKHHVIKMTELFYFRNHLCNAMELLSIDLQKRAAKEDDFHQDFRGANPLKRPTSVPNLVNVTGSHRTPPLFRAVIYGFQLQLSQPSFPTEQLPDFLYVQGQGVPKDTFYMLLIPMHLDVSLRSLQVTLRDYPLPLLHIPFHSEGKDLPVLRFISDLVIAEDMGPSQSVEWISCTIGGAQGGFVPSSPLIIEIPKTIMPVKTYANPTVKVMTDGVTIFGWGASYSATTQDLVRILESLTSETRDPSPSIGFWDKARPIFLRLIFHWTIEVSFINEVRLYMKGTRDPYTLHDEGAGFGLCWKGNPQLLIGFSNDVDEPIQVSSDTMSIIIPKFHCEWDVTQNKLDASEAHSAAPGCLKTCAKLGSGVRFGVGVILERSCSTEDCTSCCLGSSFDRHCRFFTFRPHHEVQLTTTKTDKHSQTLHDSYKGFRSDFIHLSVSLTSSLHSHTSADRSSPSSFHLTPHAFAHFWSWWALFDGNLSLPVRQGSYYPSKTVSPKFARHLATVKYRIVVPRLFISHVYIDDTRDSWISGITSFVGTKANVGHFQADMHQRDQESIAPGDGQDSIKVVRHKPFYAAEVVMKDMDLRAMPATFSEPLKQAIPLSFEVWVLAELYTGFPIFPGETEQEQLSCIMEVLGPPDKDFTNRSSRKQLFFDNNGAPRSMVNCKSRRRRPGTKTLAQVLRCQDDDFVDFIAWCLVWDLETSKQDHYPFAMSYFSPSSSITKGVTDMDFTSRFCLPATPLAGCSWERAKDARGLSRHRASCHLYKRYSVLATQKRRERAKEASHHDARIGRVRQTAPFRSPAGSGIGTLDSSGLDDLGLSLDLENDVDVEMGANCEDKVDESDDFEQPTCRIRRIPRPFHAIEPIEDDLNYSDIGQSSLSLKTHSKRPSIPLVSPDFTLVVRRSSRTDLFHPNCLRGRVQLLLKEPILRRKLMSWMNSGTSRVSETKVAALVKDVILAEDFDSKDLQGFSVRRSLRELDQDEGGKGITFPDDWIETTVTIDIPTKSKEDSPRLFSIPGFHFRPLVEVVRAAFADAQAGAFHLMPFKRLWNDPLDGHQERIYDELYTSDAWLGAQDDLHKLPKEPGCSLERVIAGLMFFSDATHLANFGTAKAWPLYAYFGNLTKYVRSSPTSGSCHLVGFLPSLPDSIKDVLSSLPRISKTGIASLLTYCRRQLFQACWEILMDEEFLYAYRHGIVLKCADGVMRRVYLRIFTYSADYPEKALIATIKDMGSCPCPRCLIPKSLFNCLGLAKDMKNRATNFRVYTTAKIVKARDFIYRWGTTVDSGKVEDTLGEGSWVPILNQFAVKLGALGLDPFACSWLLYVLPGGTQVVAALDERFRQLPTFGNGVIRRFANNTSEMKKLAARDFEDILQCAMPVFEGLFPPEHDAAVQSLLYRFAQWHALAKLRIHSDSTLAFLDETFKTLSRMLRKFRTHTCAAFNAVELPKEKAARQRRLTQRFEAHTNVAPESTGARAKMFNLNTYKFHAMGDYVKTIRLFGTTDSFTTQIGELAHRALKAFYPLTSKLDTLAQLAKHERRRRALRRIAEAGGTTPCLSQSLVDIPSSGKHYRITTGQNHSISLFAFIREHDGDPALKKFIPKLKDHVLYRLRKLDVSYCDHTFTDEERNLVIIPNNTIHSVQTMQVHYTTYDMRHDYDTINPRTHADVMVVSGETTPNHPYWYARVLGIYHIETWLNDGAQPVKQHLEILWVRWLAPLQNHKSGTRYARLPKVAFVEESDTDAFGFLDPGQVIRGVHLIPAFASGRGVSSLCHGKSLARQEGELDDWEAHYIGIFADRDMFMRYGHLGVGHPVTMRRMTRDCLSPGSAGDMNVVDDTNEVDVSHAENDDSEDCDGCGEDDDEDDGTSDEEFSDDDLEHEDEGVEKDHGWEGDEDQDDLEDDDLSF